MLKELEKTPNQESPGENSRADGSIINIPIIKLRNHPDNVKFFHDIEGEEWDCFKADIARNGILQPLLAAENGDEGYTVLSGHQRLRVARALQWHTVPCIIWKGDENHKDILFSANLGRQLTLLERYRLTMHLLDKEEDGRKENGQEKDKNGRFVSPATDSVQNGPNRWKPRERGENGRFPSASTDSAQNGQNRENPLEEAVNRDENGQFPSTSTDSVQNGQNRWKGQNDPKTTPKSQHPRDQVASMVPGVTHHDITLFRRIRELPQPVQQELFEFVEKENPNKRRLKEKVNALNAEKRRLKAELRHEKKIKQTKREMGQMRDYLDAQPDPQERYEARMFDEINRAINRACIEVSTLVAQVFAHGPVRERTARRLEPGVMALAQILKEQRAFLLESWRNYRSQANDGINALEEELI